MPEYLPALSAKAELLVLPLLLEFLPFLHFTTMKWLLLPVLYRDEAACTLLS